MTNIERVEGHMRKFAEGAGLDEIMTDYAPDAVLEAQGARQEGTAAIKGFFENTIKMMGNQQFTDVSYAENPDGSVDIEWKMGPMAGGDKFRFNDEGLFSEQKVWLGSKPADW